jgi:predicted AlkP superfamily pyrophosphatase or phosphodiesterase
MRRLRRGLARVGGVTLAALLALACLYAPLFDGLAPAALDGAPPARTGHAPHRVWLVSVDGLAPRVLASAHAPNLARLLREGLHARRATTVLPSITLAAHATMLSGLPPAAHGVYWNRYEPWRHVGVPTLFDACADGGLVCGLFAGKPKFAHFAEGEPGVARWRLGADAGAVLDAALAFARERDPDFALVHLAEVDRAGHAYGWDSEEQRRALEAIDARLGPFVDALRAASARPLALLLTADHGGHGTNHGSAAASDVEIPWVLWGDGIPAAELAEASALDTAPTILALLGLPAPAAWTGLARAGGPPR